MIKSELRVPEESFQGSFHHLLERGSNFYFLLHHHAFGPEKKTFITVWLIRNENKLLHETGGRGRGRWGIIKEGQSTKSKSIYSFYWHSSLQVVACERFYGIYNFCWWIFFSFWKKLVKNRLKLFEIDFGVFFMLEKFCNISDVPGEIAKHF